MDGFERIAAAAYSPARQYGQRYAFVRENAPGNGVAWDPDERIMTTVALSRLVQPNDADAHYAGRIETIDGGRVGVWPLDAGFRAYRLQPERRSWLDQKQAQELTLLCERWRSERQEVPDRVRHALWLHEYGMRIKYLEIRFPHIVTALEALINTDSRGLGAQFRQRVELLATHVGVEGVDADLVSRSWRTRSRWTHGSHVGVTDAPAVANELDRLERLLGLSIRRAIEDPAFRSLFRDRGSLRKGLPLAGAGHRRDPT